MNIAIIGSGLTGSLSAISLANARCRVDLYERLSDDELLNRDRTYAITHSSRRILDKLFIWEKIINDLIPFQFLNVIDYELNQKVEFNQNDLPNADKSHSNVGWIADHKKTMLVLLEIISNNDNINKIPTSVVRNPNNYDLIVVADGSNSTTKKNLKVPSFQFNYDQLCITAKVLLRGVRTNEAFEIFNSEGPFAVLPLGGDLYQIICSQTINKGSYNITLSKPLFLDYLATILPHGIEVDTIIDEIKSYPIRFILNYSFFSGKYIFLGETAHAFHPVGGQGLNLCWRDVDSLTKIISIPFVRSNKIILPILYSISRIIDVISISLLTDSLVRYSRTNIRIFNIPRNLIFYVLRKSLFARKFILNIMTNGI